MIFIIKNYYANIDSEFEISYQKINRKQNFMQDFHFHDSFEIFYCNEGKLKYTVNSKIYNIQKNDMLIMNNMDIHLAVSPKNNPYKRSLVLFIPEYIDSISTKKYDILYAFRNHDKAFCHKVSLNADENTQFLSLLKKALQIINNDNWENEIRKKIILSEILLFVNKKYKNNFSLQYSNNNSSEIAKYLNYIQNNIQSNLTLNNFEKEFLENKNTINRKFKINTGFTIRQYIINYRIMLSKKYLVQNNSVTQACYKSGFKNISNYIRTFTKIVGISPKKYQLQKNI